MFNFSDCYSPSFFIATLPACELDGGGVRLGCREDMGAGGLVLEGGSRAWRSWEAVGLAGEGVTYVGSPGDPTRQAAGRESRRH